MPAPYWSQWPDDLILRLRELWEAGHSTAEIGRRIGYSKNAVIGKARRLGLPGRGSPIHPHTFAQRVAAREARLARERAQRAARKQANTNQAPA